MCKHSGVLAAALALALGGCELILEGLECMMFDDGRGGTNVGCGDLIWGPLP